MIGHLIIMLKYPTPGEVKTRLAPAMGKQRACELYQLLVRHTLATTRKFASSAAVSVKARVAGAPHERAVREWIGSGIDFQPQGDGDLGARMERALNESFASGASPAVLIGGDCPELGVQQLERAFEILKTKELVIGPAADGGYYLIGLRRLVPAIFRNISWSTDTVLTETLVAAEREGLAFELLETLHDIDMPEDLVHWNPMLMEPIASNGMKANSNEMGMRSQRSSPLK